MMGTGSSKRALRVVVKTRVTPQQPIAGAVIRLMDQNTGVVLIHETTDSKGEVLFDVSSIIGSAIDIQCFPPQKYEFLNSGEEQQTIVVRGSQKTITFLVEDKSTAPRGGIRADEIERAVKVALADTNTAITATNTSIATTTRTLKNISALGPQDGGGGGGGIVDGAHAKKKVDTAVARVLGRPAGADPYTFLAALRGTFPEDPVEGEISRQPVRTYVVMTAESGQLSAAQGTLSREVNLIADEARTILLSLRSISPNTDQELAEALVELIRTDLDALIVEASRIDRPRKRRVDEILTSLKGAGNNKGQLKELRKALGLDGKDKLGNTKLVTPVEAQLLAAMKLLKRHVNTLGRAFDDYFAATRSSPNDNSFSGRLAYTAQLLAGVGQSTRDLRDAMAAVGLSQAESQTTFITDTTNNEEISIESILAWIESIADAEGPDMIARGGRLGLRRVLDVVQNHHLPLVNDLINEAEDPDPPHPGLAQESVLVALNELKAQLEQF